MPGAAEKISAENAVNTGVIDFGLHDSGDMITEIMQLLYLTHIQYIESDSIVFQ